MSIYTRSSGEFICVIMNNQLYHLASFLSRRLQYSAWCTRKRYIYIIVHDSYRLSMCKPVIYRICTNLSNNSCGINTVKLELNHHNSMRPIRSTNLQVVSNITYHRWKVTITCSPDHLRHRHMIIYVIIMCS